MRVFSLALLVAFVPEVDMDRVGRDMERAVILADKASLQETEAMLRDALAQDEASGGEAVNPLRYSVAYANWRLAAHHDRGSDESKELLKAAEMQLKALLEVAPEDVEAQALYGTINGALITGMWSGMRRGPRADEAFQKAIELAPANPRARMQQGVSRLFRPGAFGGGADKAEAELTDAAQLFEREARETPDTWPNWGHAEVYAWLGKSKLEQDKLDEARECYDKALELEPEYYWVLEYLLPELEDEEATR